MTSISLIIPVLNEASTLEKTVLRLLDDTEIEIIVVDGGSQDETVKISQALGVKVFCCNQTGRAHQMNIGASTATGEILIFLHADTILPQDYKHWVKTTLSNPKIIAGAFELKIDSEKLSLRLVEAMVNLRSRFLSLPYGDQAFFLYASVFRDMGGFANMPIMEDYEFIQRLRRKGKISIAPVSVITSDRRWRKLGVIKTTLINQLIIIGYYLGISPDRLAAFYRRQPK
ncbi:TIGR04283 family arsenosugar biosynthesis glycosyltransferase [Gloeothece verrucosa]|uniref:4,4'-diaponeurosporenoate glycosyltransferase n=1 Tax=Gloeothece verrucosa (strain PCC 7822) TaxID=497965 RepID=E0UGI7_GLOV7|nr:TIGR04283 family arsenosugar biosynthesis glycosyltransferase [Gloeothece verrucosa]ADN13196.1 glycosyl transferase family 2 [Gloeothece verrucosa PCC 7822]